MQRSPRILIVGGGIAGLSLGAALVQAGIRPRIIERAPEWAPVGAGIGMGLNAMLALRAIAAHDEVASRGQPADFWDLTDHRGRLLLRFDYRAMKAKLGTTMVCVHRAVLHEVLLARTSGAEVLLGVEPTRLTDTADGVEVSLTDGSCDTYDLVVGADGIRSAVRDMWFGPARARYLGYTSRRVVVERPAGIDRVIEMWGPGRRVGLCPIDEQRLYCYTTTNATENAPSPPETRVDQFRSDFAEFRSVMPGVLDQIEHPDQIFHSDLYEVRTETWMRGRVVLIGDAAHAMTPDLGQGGAMAIEDAISLAECIASQAEIPAALGAHLAKRKTRAISMQTRSRRFGRLGQLESPTLCRCRNAAIRTVASRFVGRLVADKAAHLAVRPALADRTSHRRSPR
ncbi:MAG: FAD-dependent monooxygenase [Ilumatobacteraceae bacterium]